MKNLLTILSVVSGCFLPDHSLTQEFNSEHFSTPYDHYKKFSVDLSHNRPYRQTKLSTWQAHSNYLAVKNLPNFNASESLKLGFSYTRSTHAYHSEQ